MQQCDEVTVTSWLSYSVMVHEFEAITTQTSMTCSTIEFMVTMIYSSMCEVSRLHSTLNLAKKKINNSIL